MSSNSSQGPKHVAREVSASYGELGLVELPAIDLLTWDAAQHPAN